MDRLSCDVTPSTSSSSFQHKQRHIRIFVAHIGSAQKCPTKSNIAVTETWWTKHPDFRKLAKDSVNRCLKTWLNWTNHLKVGYCAIGRCCRQSCIVRSVHYQNQTEDNELTECGKDQGSGNIFPCLVLNTCLSTRSMEFKGHAVFIHSFIWSLSPTNTQTITAMTLCSVWEDILNQWTKPHLQWLAHE